MLPAPKRCAPEANADVLRAGKRAALSLWPELESKEVRQLRMSIALLHAASSSVPVGKSASLGSRRKTQSYMRRKGCALPFGNAAWRSMKELHDVASVFALQSTSPVDRVTRFLDLLRRGGVSEPTQVVRFLASLEDSEMKAVSSHVRDSESMCAFWKWFSSTPDGRKEKLHEFLRHQKEIVETVLPAAPAELVAELSIDPILSVLQERLDADTRPSQALRRAVKQAQEDFRQPDVEFLHLFKTKPFVESVYKVAWLHYSLCPSSQYALPTVIRTVEDVEKLLAWADTEEIFKRDVRESQPDIRIVAGNLSTYLADLAAGKAAELAKAREEQARLDRWRDMLPLLRQSNMCQQGVERELQYLDDIAKHLPSVSACLKGIATEADPDTRVRLATEALEVVKRYEAQHPPREPEDFVHGLKQGTDEQRIAAYARDFLSSLAIFGYLPDEINELAMLYPRRKRVV